MYQIREKLTLKVCSTMTAEAREEAKREKAHASQNANSSFMFKKRNQKTNTSFYQMIKLLLVLV